MKSKAGGPDQAQRTLEAVAANATEPSLADPQMVLSLLEADQVVAAKRKTQFGVRKFSLGVNIVLWSLRIYVVLMFVMVLISVLRALQQSH